MNIVDLEAFVAVAESGSIVGAAAKLYLTQSAITRRIQNLEIALGVVLLDRQTRPLQMTSIGKATYESAKPVLASVDNLRSTVMHDGEPSGTFRFGIARGLGDIGVLGPISELRREFPLLKVQAYTQWTAPLIDKVRSKLLDAAAILLSNGAVPPQDVDCEMVGKQSFVIVEKKTGSKARSVELSELTACSWILSPEGCGTRSDVQSALARQRLPFAISVEAEGKDLQLALVAQGVGLGIVPVQVFEASPSREKLSVIRVKDFAPVQDLWVIKHKSNGLNTKVFKSFRTALLQYNLRKH
jgi:DNA-binding transcriptional LysR family regulator